MKLERNRKQQAVELFVTILKMLLSRNARKSKQEVNKFVNQNQKYLSVRITSVI
jgi:uncharacterized protein (UPF0147 family)